MGCRIQPYDFRLVDNCQKMVTPHLTAIRLWRRARPATKNTCSTENRLHRHTGLKRVALAGAYPQCYQNP